MFVYLVAFVLLLIIFGITYSRTLVQNVLEEGISLSTLHTPVRIPWGISGEPNLEENGSLVNNQTGSTSSYHSLTGASENQEIFPPERTRLRENRDSSRRDPEARRHSVENLTDDHKRMDQVIADSIWSKVRDSDGSGSAKDTFLDQNLPKSLKNPLGTKMSNRIYNLILQEKYDEVLAERPVISQKDDRIADVSQPAEVNKITTPSTHNQEPSGTVKKITPPENTDTPSLTADKLENVIKNEKPANSANSS